MHLPAQAQAFTDDLLIITGRVLLRGWSYNATTPGIVALYDQRALTDTSRPVGMIGTTAEITSSSAWFGDTGILCESGLGAVVTTFEGTVVVWYTPETLIMSALIMAGAGSDRSITPYVDQADIERLFGRA